MSGRHQPEHGADSAEALLQYSCLGNAWPCLMHDEHVLKAGRYNPGWVPEEYGPGDWEPSNATHLRPDTTERLLGWIDRRLADIESDLGDDETMKSRGLHGTAVLHERRDTLKFMRAQIEQDR